MKLTGLHLLFTLQCTKECDHCFVWGSPWQEGVMTLAQVREILRQAREMGGIEWIYFEGGEPFLFHPILARAVAEAYGSSFKVGIVTNAYWAAGPEDAREWLRPLVGRIEEICLSGDLYHHAEGDDPRVAHARAAADALGVPVNLMRVSEPEVGENPPDGQGPLLCKGRAAVKLSGRAPQKLRRELDSCPWEDLRDPGRVHVDPFGNLHPCQGISIGNLFERPLREICESYEPEAHPIIGPLLEGGPAELARRHRVAADDLYAGACHLCYETRCALLSRFPETLTPEAFYKDPAGD